MKKTILLAAMFATVASFADGNYVKFSTNVEKNFDTTYKRAEADAGAINKGQALTTKADGTEKAEHDLKKDSQTNDADKSVKLLDDANLSFGPEIKVTLGDSGFSFGGKLMNKTTFNSFDLSRDTLADGNSEAWGMFVLPKEAVKDLSASVKFAIKTSKDVKNPELGLYDGDTKLDPENDGNAVEIFNKINTDSKADVKYMSFDTENSKTPVDFKSDDPNAKLTSEVSKTIAKSYKDYMNDKSESIKTEGVLDTTLDYALETKDLKSANIGLNTSTSFEFKKDTGFTTTYTAYADVKGETSAFRTELETANNYKDSRFKGFKYVQSNTTMKKGIFDSSILLYGSLDKLDNLLQIKDDYYTFNEPTSSDSTTAKNQIKEKKDIVKKYIKKLEDSYLDAKKDDAKKIKEAYDKTLNTKEENMDKAKDKAVTDAKKDLISENVKKDGSLVYLEGGTKLVVEPIENLKLGLDYRGYASVIADLGPKYTKLEASNKAKEIQGTNLDSVITVEGAKDSLGKYFDTTVQVKDANKLGLFAEYTVFGINAKLSNDLEILASGKVNVLETIAQNKKDNTEQNTAKKDNGIKELKLMLQEKPALNLAYTYNYKDMLTLENKLGVSGIINFSKDLKDDQSKLGVDSAVISVDPEINATIKATDKLSFTAGTKVVFDALIHKVKVSDSTTESMNKVSEVPEEKGPKASVEPKESPEAPVAPKEKEPKVPEKSKDSAKQEPKMEFATDYKTEIIPSVGVVLKATDKLTLDSTTSLDVNLINSRLLKSAIKFGGSLKYEW